MPTPPPLSLRQKIANLIWFDHIDKLRDILLGLLLRAESSIGHIQPGNNITLSGTGTSQDDPLIITATGAGGAGVQSVADWGVGNITVDNSDPQNPVISANQYQQGDGIEIEDNSDFYPIIHNRGVISISGDGVDNTDPQNPVINTGSELEKITENGNTGYRILGRLPNRYGDIGNEAVDLSYSLGNSTTRGATGHNSYAEGYNTTASGQYSHAEGAGSVASGANSHAEGSGQAIGTGSHAEGAETTAMGTYSHVEGYQAVARGDYSHAEGWVVDATGVASHAGGWGNVAASFGETVIGTFSENISGNADEWVQTDYAYRVGIGIDTARADGFRVRKNGEVLAPSLGIDTIDGAGNKVLITKEYFEKATEEKIIPDATYTLEDDDHRKILHFTSATAVTVTVPSGLTAKRFEGKQLGAGQVEFTGSGTTLRKAASEQLKTAEQYSAFSIDLIGTEEYMIYGKLELV